MNYSNDHEEVREPYERFKRPTLKVILERSEGTIQSKGRTLKDCVFMIQEIGDMLKEMDPSK